MIMIIIIMIIIMIIIIIMIVIIIIIITIIPGRFLNMDFLNMQIWFYTVSAGCC